MSIQQSINQMLALTATGAGLYAHSPEGQRQAEIKKLERQLEAKEKTITKGLNSQKQVKEAAEIADQLFELDPSQKRYDTAEAANNRSVKYHEQLQQNEQNKQNKNREAFASLVNSLDIVQSRKTSLPERKAILKKFRNKGGR